MVQDYRASALENPMHIIVDKLLAWLQYVSGKKLLVKHQSLGAPSPASGLLPPLKILLGRSHPSGRQVLIGLEYLGVSGQHKLVVFLDVAEYLVLSGPMCSDIGTQEAKLGPTVSLGTPCLLLSCTICQQNGKLEVQPDIP